MNEEKTGDGVCVCVSGKEREANSEGGREYIALIKCNIALNVLSNNHWLGAGNISHFQNESHM